MVLARLRKETYARLKRNVRFAAGVWSFAILGLLFASLYLHEHIRRVSVLQLNSTSMAAVTGRHQAIGRSTRCISEFTYSVHGKGFASQFPDCPHNLPPGTMFQIAVDPADPNGAFPLFEGEWEANGQSGFLMWAALVLFFTIMALSIGGPSGAELLRRKMSSRSKPST